MSNLTKPVLILNKGYSPIDACSVRDAISDVAAERAKFICPDTYAPFSIEQWIELPVNEGDPFIQAVDCKIRVPEVIRSTYDRIPKRKVVFSRRNLWKRDKMRCQYCGRKPKPDEITIDHVIPKSHGGKTTFENCVLACFECNKKKDNRTPEQAKMPLIKMVLGSNNKYHKENYDRPKSPKWSPIYSIQKSNKIPESWTKFVAGLIDELYWNTELEE